MKFLVQECCCGCSLRIGSLIILWFYLVATLISTVISLRLVFNFNGVYLFLVTFFIIVSFVGSLCSLGALISIMMNKANFLTPVYFHMLWVIAYGIFCTMASVCVPLFSDNAEFNSVKSVNDSEHVIRLETPVAGILLILLCETVGLGLLGYFALVIKSYRNAMVVNHATEAELLPTQESIASITMQHSDFLPSQLFTGLSQLPLPPYTRTKPFVG